MNEAKCGVIPHKMGCIQRTEYHTGACIGIINKYLLEKNYQMLQLRKNRGHTMLM